MGLTAYVCALAVRSALHPSHMPSGWLLPLDFWLHGWPLLVANVVFYAYLCWIGFWFVRRTPGRERVVMGGWFVGILILPLKALWPAWAVAIRCVEAIGFLVALFAAVSLLLYPAPAAALEP